MTLDDALAALDADDVPPGNCTKTAVCFVRAIEDFRHAGRAVNTGSRIRLEYDSAYWHGLPAKRHLALDHVTQRPLCRLAAT
jgi:hypothetical protein